MNVKEILHREPPETLYHYTTLEGLLGIANKKEIWATHTQYLNDMLEFRYALRIVEEEIQAMESGSESGTRKDVLARMKDGTQGIGGINVCVASFCENGDALSQWRAYGGPAGGFALGFSGKFLRSVLGDGFWLVPCEYAESQQRELIRRLLEDVVAENQRRVDDEGDGNDGPAGGNLVAYLSRYAPILKHPSFGEEKEWRIVSPALSCRSDRFGFRAGASMLVPYYRIPLDTSEQSFEIEEVIVGPTPHPKQSVHSVRSLLIRCMQDPTKVSESEVPYRNW